MISCFWFYLIIYFKLLSIKSILSLLRLNDLVLATLKTVIRPFGCFHLCNYYWLHYFKGLLLTLCGLNRRDINSKMVLMVRAYNYKGCNHCRKYFQNLLTRVMFFLQCLLPSYSAWTIKETIIYIMHYWFNRLQWPLNRVNTWLLNVKCSVKIPVTLA